MARWEITPDEAGIPLSPTPVGRFLRETANLLRSDVKISQIFAPNTRFVTTMMKPAVNICA